MRSFTLVFRRKGDGRALSVVCLSLERRLKPRGGGVNAAIFSAGGHASEVVTKEEAETISPRSSIAVQVPKTSLLFKTEGVTHVIHVLGPNMNPQRPNYLKGDYVKGCEVLRDAYCSLFRNFVSLTRNHNCQKEYGEDSYLGSSSIAGKGIMDCLSLDCEQKTKREGNHVFDMNKKSKCYDKLVEEEEQKNNMTAAPAIRTWGSWAQALHRITLHPELHKGVLEMSVDYVVINDFYPKVCEFLRSVFRGIQIPIFQF
ncbi:Transcription factor bHLH140 [Apostasia shenzhenica]|uniref:Transcription factor bHLH140 n=1 Tax=Apostasia shenzhenica TaxID=1088818 RepID=A0A2I0BH25_9ASPA|nr:Transcription factor bHLH140 [Apostasia shenzhenica]